MALHLSLSGADWEPVFVDYFNGQTKTQEFRALNPMGEVPVLEHAGDSYTQSGVILDYLAETTGRFGPANGAERREILRWLLFDNHKLTGYLATFRFLRTFVRKANPDVVGFLGGRAKAAMAVLEAHLARHDFAVADRPTIADLSMAGYMYYGDELGIDIDGEFPGVARWRDRIADLPGWQHPYDLMPGHPLPAEREKSIT